MQASCPLGYGSRRLAAPVAVGAPLARAGVCPQTDQVPTLPTKFDQGVRPGPGLCAYVAPAILGSKFHFISLKTTHKGRPPGPARFRRATGRLIQGSTATPLHKARYIDAAPCHGPNLVFERSPEPPEVSLRLRDRGGTRQTAAIAQSCRRNILLRRINGQLKPVEWPAQASANCKTAPSGDEIAPMAPFELPRRSAGAISIPEDLPWISEALRTRVQLELELEVIVQLLQGNCTNPPYV